MKCSMVVEEGAQAEEANQRSVEWSSGEDQKPEFTYSMLDWYCTLLELNKKEITAKMFLELK